MRHALPILIAALSLASMPARSQQPGAVRAAEGLLARVAPAAARRVSFRAIQPEQGRDTWSVEAKHGRVVVSGSSGVAMASGLNWYLENKCHSNISWCGTNVRIPTRLPDVQPAVRKSTPYRYRYFLNYCAFSYSLAWWDWAEWERLIDWMALHGINMPLSVTGQEAVWEALGRRLGITRAEMDQFLVGPAYLPFGWMGCIDGWGGPLPSGWTEHHTSLQRQILAREREFGMKPVLQGFTGHVPPALARLYPKANLRRLPSWCNFPPTLFVDPTDPLFRTLGKAFIEEQTRLYGSDHLYAADTFIEMPPPSNDPAFLRAMGQSVLGAMTDADPQATWVMQGWLFVNAPSFWQRPQARALLQSVPDDRMVVLDLMCESDPAWKRTEAFHGKPWVFCTIQTFGDVVSLHGALKQIATNLGEARAAAASAGLVGLGHIMEGLGCNPVVHSLVTDMTWDPAPPNIDEWVTRYVERRYGVWNAHATRAWRILLKTAYASSGPSGAAFTQRPSLGASGAGPSADLVAAWREMAAASGQLGSADTYRFDLANLGREVLARASADRVAAVRRAYEAGDRRALAAASGDLQRLLADLDALLATRPELLLGKWVANARRFATTAPDARHLEWNARTQVTLWGPPDSLLHEYAQKQWSGMVRGFYSERWQLFTDALESSLKQGKPLDGAAFEKKLQAWEDLWCHTPGDLPTEPSGHSLTLTRELLARYGAGVRRHIVRSLATGKPATCSHSLQPFPASLANDGGIDDTDRYWATDVGVSPGAWWQVDLGKPEVVGRVVLVSYYGDTRTYGYLVEGSLDGKAWSTLSDLRTNRIPSTRDGVTAKFAAQQVRYLRVTVTSNSANSGRHLVEVLAYRQ